MNFWFLKGDTNIKYLTDNGIRIWNEWADDKGDLGLSTENNGEIGIMKGLTKSN